MIPREPDDDSPLTRNRLLARMTTKERAYFEDMISEDKKPWRPLPGPQRLAYDSPATIVGYGGAAGGGKTDLAIGLALTKHQRVGIFRQNGTELVGIVDRVAEVLKNRDGYNGADRIWRTSRSTKKGQVAIQIEFGSFPAPNDEKKYQGRPHDLLVFDEASNMREAAVRFLLGWLRTTDPKQPCRALLAFNPPTSADGRWVVDFFGPWLDDKHPNPAAPGELRWFATVNGRDYEVENSREFVLEGDVPLYSFSRSKYSADEIIQPQSRTFIPSRIVDNPYLLSTGYMAQLQSLPEPLRSQMLRGDFSAGMEDDPWQVIPTEWVKAAQARWVKPLSLPPMDGMGVDVARGGKDNTVIARRHGMWFDVPLTYPGSQTPDGPHVVGLVMAAHRDHCPIHIDVIGVGSSPYDFLVAANQQVIGVNVSERSIEKDKSGRMGFKNQRSELWWRMREALDPANNTGICLPPDKRLTADLCAPKWEPAGDKIAVQSREDIIDTVGRSPDYASAYCLALMQTPKAVAFEGLSMPGRPRRRKDYDPFADV